MVVLLPLLALLATPAVAVHHFKELNNLRDLEQLGIVDPSPEGELSGRALKHTLLGFARTNCVNELRQLGFPGDFGQLGENFETGEVILDRHESLGSTFNVSDCKDFVFIPKGANVSEYEVVRPHDKVSLSNWVYEHLKVELQVLNDLDFEVEVKWEDRNKQPQDLVRIPPGKSAWVNTFESHHLIFYKKQVRMHEPLLRVRVGDPGSIKLSDYVLGDAMEQCVNPHDCEAPEPIQAGDAIQITQEDMETWKIRDTNNFNRIIRNEEQPTTKPFFTELGFKKMRIPDDIYAIMLNRFNEGKHAPIAEPWSKSDCHTNFFEVPSRMVYLNEDDKAKVFAGLKPILEEWAGGIKLKPTSCYGVRMYYNGSWLREHVDTGSTHIISAIAQIAQEGMEEDWSLTFVDHKGGRHYITMEPQDLVLYESATCLHGRPKPMRGGYFANVFTHFMPTDWK